MIYFEFNGYRNDRLIITPVSWTETPTASDTSILDVELLVTGQAFYDTTIERDDAFAALSDWFDTETGTFAVMYQNEDANLCSSEIFLSAGEFTQGPNVVDFSTDGSSFSFRVIGKRKLPQRTREKQVVGRDLTYTVSVTGGTGTGIEI